MGVSTYVEVSPEMTTLLGTGPFHDAPLPLGVVALSFDLNSAGPTVSFHDDVDLDEGDARLVLAIQPSAFARIGGVWTGDQTYHLPSTLRAIAMAVRDCSLSGEAQNVYRLGKSIELICETIRLHNAGEFVALAPDCALSAEDTRRVAAARRMIDERWSEKLTLDKIARACGLNRAKLTRGFRDMFSCTIAEALAEKRLQQASVMLRTTDKPVSSIGYENGYLNNASFARAFSRRFGLSPSDFRACQLAA
ncbi:MAG: AraC family transcriptional regulator [Terricaulis sp.]